MCGIVAAWNRDGRPLDARSFARAVQRLARRGPDDAGIVLFDTRTGAVSAHHAADGDGIAPESLPALGEHAFDLALGHRRLSIVDRSPRGHQPMATPDRRFWIAFNGMVYNFRELRAELAALGHEFQSDGDTEVVLRSFAQWGPDGVHRFNGMWAFAVWDAEQRRLHLSRDRLGLKPLVHRTDADRFVGASSLAALDPLGALEDGIDPDALHHYLSLMEVPAPFTIHRGVRKLPPAHHLRIDRAGDAAQRYWHPLSETTQESLATLEADAGREQLTDLIQDSVRLRMVADVPVGCFLSGGVDSGLVTALAAARSSGRALPTYSITAPDHPRVDESRWSDLIAGSLGTAHHRLELRSSDFQLFDDVLTAHGEPYAVSSALGVQLVARAARSDVRVLLSGDGGDELFAGYEPRYVAVDEEWDRIGQKPLARLRRERARAMAQPVRWRERASSTGLRHYLRSLATGERAARDSAFLYRRCMFNDREKDALYTPAWREGRRGPDTIPWLAARLEPDPGDRLLRWQLHDVDSMLHDEMTAKLDHSTMHWGIEGRAPILDHRVAEFALRLPAAMKVRDGEGKWIWRQVAQRYLPAEILTRPKRGFTIPLEDWFRAGLRDRVRDALSPSALRDDAVFDPRAVADVVALFEREPNFHTAHMVFILMCFQMWRRQRAT